MTMMKIFERVIFPIMIGVLVALLITFRCSNEQPSNTSSSKDHSESLAAIGGEMNAIYDSGIQQLLFERDSLNKRLKQTQGELQAAQQLMKSQSTSLTRHISSYEMHASSEAKLPACDSLVRELKEHLLIVSMTDSLCDHTQNLLDIITESSTEQVTILVAKASHWEITAHAALADRDGLKATNETLTRKWKNGKVIQKVLATGLIVTVAILGAHYTVP